MQWNEFSLRIRHFDSADQKMLQQAFETGKKAHEGQYRQSGEPYFTHPIAVAQMLIDLHADKDTIAAALLHDTVEDTALTLADIEREFNPVVASLVDGVTKLSEQDVQQIPNLNEQIESLRKIFVLMQKDIRIMVIKLADRLHNMQTISFQKPQKQQMVAKETLDVYVKIADRLCMRDFRDMLEDLCRSVLEPEMHAHIVEIQKKNETRSLEEIIHIEKQIHNADTSINVLLKPERKTWEKMRLQYELEGEDVSGISGINIAFVCKDIPGCYHMLGILHQLWQREIMSFDDFINAPVVNGYQSVHTTIILEDGMRVRCKIRTEEMDRYAHQGVALVCFDQQTRGVMDYLPWVGQISPLSEDTAQRSERFWESLQTDILGESIIIHGPSDQAALVPKNATALDCIFYLFGKEALQTQSITVNGKNASFHEEIPNASTVNATFSDTPQVQLKWLTYVHTGMATAMIRQELIKAPPEDKEFLGRRLLEQAVLRQGQVGLDELSNSIIKSLLRSYNFSSSSELYSDIAVGKLDPDQVARNIFQAKEDTAIASWTLAIHSATPLHPSVEKIIRMFPFYKLSFRAYPEGGAALSAKYALTAPQLYRMQTALSTLLQPDQWSLTQGWNRERLFIIMVALVILWGLDPVFARFILAENISATDLTIIRFITFFIASGLAYIGQTLFTRKKYKPLSPFQPSLVLSGIALFITGICTYTTLSHLSATQYILYIIAGVVLSNTVKTYLQGHTWQPLAVSSAILVIGIGAVSYFESTSLIGAFSAIASSLGFVLYSEVSRRYQEEVTTIQGRYPAFMFWVSAVCLLLSLVIAPLSDFSVPSPDQLLNAVVFALIFAVVPYALYFESMRRSESKFLGNSLPLVFISTLIGEMLLTRNTIALIATPLIFVFFYLYLQQKRKEID